MIIWLYFDGIFVKRSWIMLLCQTCFSNLVMLARHVWCAILSIFTYVVVLKVRVIVVFECY